MFLNPRPKINKNKNTKAKSQTIDIQLRKLFSNQKVGEHSIPLSKLPLISFVFVADIIDELLV